MAAGVRVRRYPALAAAARRSAGGGGEIEHQRRRARGQPKRAGEGDKRENGGKSPDAPPEREHWPPAGRASGKVRVQDKTRRPPHPPDARPGDSPGV